MSNESFVALIMGMAIGFVLGVFCMAFTKAISDTRDRENDIRK